MCILVMVKLGFIIGKYGDDPVKYKKIFIKIFPKNIN